MGTKILGSFMLLQKYSIQKLQNTEGEWVERHNGLEVLITSYFKNIFTTMKTQWGEVVNKVTVTITAAHNEDMLREISVEEVRFALL